MKYVIGIDGGGTKTEAVAYSLEGEELGRGLSGFGNMLLNQEKATQNILDAAGICMEDVKASFPGSDCILICPGIAGINSGRNKEILEAMLCKSFGVEVKAVNDAELALSALLKGEDGVLTISGTGSISYGVFGENSARAGGWGHILGDEGSGYFIALEALRNIALEDDLGMAPGKLSRAIMERLKISRADEIKGFVYSSQKADIAALAPAVVQQSEEGEETARGILSSAGNDLAQMTLRVCKKLCLEGRINVGIKGSILTNVKFVSNEFEKTLRREIKDLNIVDEDVSPAKGALYINRKLQMVNNKL